MLLSSKDTLRLTKDTQNKHKFIQIHSHVSVDLNAKQTEKNTHADFNQPILPGQLISCGLKERWEEWILNIKDDYRTIAEESLP